MRDSIGILDRLFSCISYITAGWGGMIVLVVMYFRKKTPSRFLRYNAMQSIFISLFYFILAMGLGLILKFLSYIPFINYLVAQTRFSSTVRYCLITHLFNCLSLV